MVSTSPGDAEKELLTLARLPGPKLQLTDLANKVSEALKKTPEPASKAEGQQDNETPAKDSIEDDGPFAKLRGLNAQTG